MKDDRHPGLVGAEALEGQVGQSAGLPGAHPVLDPGVAPVAQFECGDVVALCVGDEAGVAPPGVGVEEGELGARVRALAPADHPHVGGPALDLVELGQLDDLGAVSDLPVELTARAPSPPLGPRGGRHAQNR